MISQNDLKSFKDLASEFKPDPTFFERNILVPQIWGRLSYTREIFISFKAITEQKDIASLIDKAVSNLGFPIAKTKQAEPEFGRYYLEHLRFNMIDSYINPIAELLNRYPITRLKDGNIDLMISFFNEARVIFDSIVSVKESMFLFSFKGIVNIRSAKTGVLQSNPAEDFSVILAPFEIRMNELTNVASTASDSIKIWNESLKEQNKKHLEMISSMYQVKSSREQSSAAKWNIAFQVVVIIFALIGVILSQPVGTYVEKKMLEGAYQENIEKLAICEKGREKQENRQ